MKAATRPVTERILRAIEKALEANTPEAAEEIRAYLALRVGTWEQRTALRYALADQGRAVRRDRDAYYENVEDAEKIEAARRVLEELL